MARIPTRTIEDSPAASRPLLEAVVHTSPTGRPLNLQAQLAHSPTALVSYVSMRRATEEHGTLDPRHRSAIMLATAASYRSEYAEAVTSLLAVRAGWSEKEVVLLRSGDPSGDHSLDALLAVVREAAVNTGRVDDKTWAKALESGWDAEQLTEAFAYLGLTTYSAFFLNYAKTELDVPTGSGHGA